MALPWMSTTAESTPRARAFFCYGQLALVKVDGPHARTTIAVMEHLK